MSDLDLGGQPTKPTQTATSAPPAGGLVLEAPAAVAVVEETQAVQAVPVSTEAQTELDKKAQAYVEDLTSMDMKSPAFTEKVNSIVLMGDSEIRKSSEVSNRMLQRPAAQGGKDSAQSKVSGTLVDLRQTITDLDPNRADLKGAKKVLKWLPGGDKVDRYFMKYQSSQTHLNSIIAALESGQDDLRKDNAGIQLEQTRLWESLIRLRDLDEKMTQLDAAIEQRVAELGARGETEKADAMKSQVLFTVRQRRQDLATEIAVATQGYMSLGLVLQNNDQLITAVDRAKSTTVAALYTAVIVSEALARQKLVLDQINALRSTTSNMIEATSKQLRTQGAEINAKSTESLVEVQKLENAFTNVFATMDAIDSYRSAATDSMAATITSLQTQIKRAEPYMERARKQQLESNENMRGQLPGGPA